MSASILKVKPNFKEENINEFYGSNDDDLNDLSLTESENPYIRKAKCDAATAQVQSKMPGPITKYLSGLFMRFKWKSK